MFLYLANKIRRMLPSIRLICCVNNSSTNFVFYDLRTQFPMSRPRFS